MLASASPARLRVLQAAGVQPLVEVSQVDEDAVLAALPAQSPPATAVVALAQAKAEAVARRLCESDRPPGISDSVVADCVVVGCDSMLAIDGDLRGKPKTAAVAHDRWQQLSGRSADLMTGHCVLRVQDGQTTATACGCTSTTVHFAAPDPDELAAYIASGEPLEVAGGFTLDGLGGWFIERVDGDPSNVIGLGLPLLRMLLREVGVGVAELWSDVLGVHP